MTTATVNNQELVITINETIAYNSRARKLQQIYAYVYDEEHNLLDVITPDIQTNHKQAKEWAEMRAQTIPNEYPEVARVEIHTNDDSLGDILIITYTPKENMEPNPDDKYSYSILVDAINKGTIIVNTVSISQSGLSRKFRFYAVGPTGRLLWLNGTISHLLAMKMDCDGNLVIRGWGMDFAVDILMKCTARLQDKYFNCEYNGHQRI